MTLLMGAVSLRPAIDDDYVTHWRIHRVAMRAYVGATWGWDEAWQQNYFRDRWNPDQLQSIVADDRCIGRLAVKERAGRIDLATIEISPSHQGHGFGTAIVSAIVADGRGRGLPVRLRVLKVNPAGRLFARLGFGIVGETDTHFEMEAPPV